MKINFDRQVTYDNGANGRPASVLIPLIQQNDAWYVLFEVRSQKLRTQPGEICFPGGRIEKGEDPKDTAVRETCEELCIHADQITVLGQSDGTLRTNGATVYAYVGIIRDYAGTYSNDEVAEVFLVPLKELLSIQPIPGTVTQEMRPTSSFPLHLIPNHDAYQWPDSQREILFYPWHEYMIWGMTARILHSFLSRIENNDVLEIEV